MKTHTEMFYDACNEAAELEARGDVLAPIILQLTSIASSLAAIADKFCCDA